MEVEIFDVRIPAPTTKFMQVPAYDIPVLRKIWRGHLPNDINGQPAQIQIFKTGRIEPRNFHSERLRISRDYRSTLDNGKVPAWQEVYKTESDLLDAYQRAVAEAQAAKQPMPTVDLDAEDFDDNDDDGETPVGDDDDDALAGAVPLNEPPRRRGKSKD